MNGSEEPARSASKIAEIARGGSRNGEIWQFTRRWSRRGGGKCPPAAQDVPAVAVKAARHAIGINLVNALLRARRAVNGPPDLLSMAVVTAVLSSSPRTLTVSFIKARQRSARAS